MKTKSLASLWGLVLLCCGVWAELGRLAGIVPRPVLDDLLGQAKGWWDLPAALHAVALAALLGSFLLLGRHYLRGLGPRGRDQWTIVVAFVLIGVFLCLNQFGELNNVISRKTDFATIYNASRALCSGNDPYAATGNGYFYPPLLAFLFGPLTLLPLSGASTLFFSLKVVLVAWSLAACYGLTAGDEFAGWRRSLFVFGLAFVAARFWIADLQFGNTNLIIMFLMIAAVAHDHRNLSIAAGFALALALSIKVVPGVLVLHFVVQRRWRTLLSCAAAVVALNAMPWAVLGNSWSSAWTAYLDVGVAGKLNARLAQPDNQSLWGLLGRSLPDVTIPYLRALWATVGLVLAGFAAAASFRSLRKGPLARVAAAALYPLLGLMVSPGSWVVHYTAVLLPMAVLWKLALSGRASGRWAWPVFALTNVAYTLSGWSRPTVAASIDQSWFVLATLILFAGLGSWVLRRSTGPR